MSSNQITLCTLTLLLATLGATPTTRINAYPWENAIAMEPPRARKAWIPCYHIMPNRLDATLRAHDKFIGEIRQQKPAVLFVGDSLTGNWRTGSNAELWKEYFAPLNAYNVGINGDMTEHVLWRLDNGELDAAPPKVIVLMIGTNNLWRDKPEDVVKGVKAILDLIHTKAPDSKVLLLGLLPRADREALADFPEKIKAANGLLSKLDDPGKVRYVSFADKFLDQDGKPAKGLFADGLHPTPKGYEIWAKQVKPVLDEMLK